MTYSGLYLRADEKIFKLQICISEWINVLSCCFVHTLSEQRSTRKRIQHWHLNRFSCNFFRQFNYTIAGVLPIVRYTFSALWQMNSRNFLQVKRHLIERLWEPEKKKNSNKELSQAISGRTWTSWRGCGWTAVPPWANGSWSATFSYRKEKCN